ncbi:hypothetical protein N9Z47_03585, partial [bacterium]|nr:hypothetical protein [bacterium]
FIVLKEAPAEPAGQVAGEGVEPVRASQIGTGGRQEEANEIQEIEEPKVPMFRRIRNLVPQRKSPAK